ncbi:MAG TPA: GTPase [Acidimicrobiia bacterium]|nr:GTPase [Acidimicrobiia bacterium]
MRESLAALAEGTEAARDLGLDTSDAERTAALIEQRIGFAGNTYVIALAGGTGVGKSSLLNALAESKVSEVRAIRPTTSRPLAWVEENDRKEVQPLLEWVGVEDVVDHQHRDLADVAIIDLPDVDSVNVAHRATVDALLPRIDALYWVVDPEKYDDERLHGYLRQLSAHGERMVFLFNKADRLDDDDQRLLEEDFARRLSTDGIGRSSIRMLSAHSGQGVPALRRDLAGAADRKAAVVAKLATDAATALSDVAGKAGIQAETPPSPLVDPKARQLASEGAVAGALAVVDPAGVGRQVRAAVQSQARRQGGSLLVRILAWLSSLTGTRRRTADPEGYLMNWRRRGSLGHILNPIRKVVTDALAKLPPGGRGPAIAALGMDELETRLVSALDQATRQSREIARPPRSFLWGLIGAIQLGLGAVLLFAIAWYLTIIFGPGGIEVATVEVPYLGPVPVPLVLAVASLVASFIFGALLSIHAGWIGRRQGRLVAARVTEAVQHTVADTAFAPLDRMDEARRRLFAALVRSRG